MLLAAYIVSSVLTAIPNTLHELTARHNRSILVNWVWIEVLVFAAAGFAMLPLAPCNVIIWLIAFRVTVVFFSLHYRLRRVASLKTNTKFNERTRHGAEYGFNMAVETWAVPILTYAAFMIGGSTATDAIYAFSVEANFFFISITKTSA